MPDNMTDEFCGNDFRSFVSMQDRVVPALDKLESCLLALGLFGNILALATFVRSPQMHTPSFVYHKALVSAYLVYCMNFLIVKFINLTLTVPESSQRQVLNYPNPIVAYYALILTKVFTSVCGFMALYTSSAISIDRFLALAVFKHYSKFNRFPVAYAWVTVSLILSICVHSWSPWLEMEIVPDAVNHTVTAYRLGAIRDQEKLRPYLMAKDWYNFCIRFVYALLLITFTCIVIYKFAKQRKKRMTICNVSKRQLRRERSLFYLMVAVVLMACLQLIPREVKRILEFIYPPEYVSMKLRDDRLPEHIRCGFVVWGLYVFNFSNSILNLCTIMERSLIFYFYFGLNHSFRKEVLIILRLNKVCRRVATKMGLAKFEANKKRKGVAKETRVIIENSSNNGGASLNERPNRWRGLGRFGSENTNENLHERKHFLSPDGSHRSRALSLSSSVHSGFSSEISVGV